MCVSFAWCVDDLNILLTCISSTPHGAATARSWSQCTERSTGSCVTHQSGWERLMPPATLRWLSTSRSGAFPPSSCESVCVLWVQVWVHESVCCGCRCGCMSLFVCCGCRCGCMSLFVCCGCRCGCMSLSVCCGCRCGCMSLSVCCGCRCGCMSLSVCCGCRCGCMSLSVCCGCRCGCIIGGSCHKYHLCHDKSFVVTNVCLSWQNMSFDVTKVCLSWQNFCCDKKILLQQNICRDNFFFMSLRQIFVGTKICCDEHMLVVTNIILSQQNFCCKKHTFVATKDMFCHDVAQHRQIRDFPKWWVWIQVWVWILLFIAFIYRAIHCSQADSLRTCHTWFWMSDSILL